MAKKSTPSKSDMPKPDTQRFSFSFSELSRKRKPFAQAVWADVADVMCVDDGGASTLTFYTVDPHERELVEVARLQMSLSNVKRLIRTLDGAVKNHEAGTSSK